MESPDTRRLLPICRLRPEETHPLANLHLPPAKSWELDPTTRPVWCCRVPGVAAHPVRRGTCALETRGERPRMTVESLQASDRT